MQASLQWHIADWWLLGDGKWEREVWIEKGYKETSRVIDYLYCSDNLMNAYVCVYSVTQLYLTLCNPMDCSLPGSSVHGIFQARVLERIAISSSKGSSRPRNQIHVSGFYCADSLPLHHLRSLMNAYVKAHQIIHLKYAVYCMSTISGAIQNPKQMIV